MDHREDIRWQQRFFNFKKALVQLAEAVNLSKERNLTRLEKIGLIQAFEFTHELAWNVFKDFFKNQGNNDIKGSKDATRQAFKEELIEDGISWMEMINSRNESSHTYNESVAEIIVEKTINIYLPLFEDFVKVMDKIIARNNKI